MAIRHTNVFLWTGVVVACLGAVAGYHQLAQTQKFAQLASQEEGKSHEDLELEAHSTQISAQTENAIKLESLGQLIQSPNTDVKAASLRIILERTFGSGEVWKLLRRDIASQDVKAKNRALSIMAQFVKPIMSDHRIHFVSIYTYRAIIQCLRGMLPEARAAIELGYHHTAAEADALWLLHKLVEIDVIKALNAGLVTKWLSKYPFEEPHSDESKAKCIWNMIALFEYSDDYERLLLCVLYEMQQYLEARTEMSQYGLWDLSFGLAPGNHELESQWESRRHHSPLSSYTRLPSGSHMSVDDITTLEPAEAQNVSTMRDHEESIEERALRRRRREAMVLGEEGRALSREDIIERD